MSHFLVRHRKLLFVLMAVFAVVSALLVPQIHINTDMTQYLPDAYPMRQGLDCLQEQLPEVASHMQDYGSIFADGSNIMPTDLPRTLAIGVGLLFAVLLLMCASLMEVPLFLLTTGFAVLINMGTNALLPSVSMLTNTLTPVLQMVLSMDYSIILMNRYRQEIAAGKGSEQAMEGAIGGAASSILSSAFTTIVSLLMLCFIKLRMGADLGIVLAKGVSFSLLCNFTVLPFLIMAGHKAILATQKKVPVFPAACLARFEHRFRYPLLVLFVGIFACFSYLQRRTPLCFAPQFESTVSGSQPDDNILMLLYPTAREADVPALLDSIAALPRVHQCVSYPSLVLRPRTAAELSALMAELAPDQSLPEEMLRLVYYARFRPERTERMSFQELQDQADTLSARGLVPAGRMEEFVIQSVKEESTVTEESTPSVDPSSPPAPQEDRTRTAPQEDSTKAVFLSASEESTEASPVVVQKTPYSYEELNTALTAADQAAFLGGNPREVAMVYRMAGRKNQTMTPAEFLYYSRDKILTNKRLSLFVSKESAAELVHRCALVDSVLAAGPTPVPSPQESEEAGDNGQVELTAASDPEEADEPAPGPAPSSPPAKTVQVSPLERLADMALSSRRFTSAQMGSALQAAGIPVTREELDLLFLYAGAQKDFDPAWRLSPEELLRFVADTLLTGPGISAFVPDSTQTRLLQARDQLTSQLGQLRGPDYSAAVVMSGYEAESDASHHFMDQLRQKADDTFQEPHFWIGETEMYKELKEGFPSELLLLTLLTVLSIFLIVAVNFRSLLIPVPLVMTILSGVFVNVWASGLGGMSMYYMAYLIVQGILMGATIDYTIVFTHYYRQHRRLLEVAPSLEAAYRDSSHSILTSGLILTLVPFVMFFTMEDPMIGAILRSLGTGALAVVLLLMLVLPGVLAALDPILNRRKK